MSGEFANLADLIEKLTAAPEGTPVYARFDKNPGDEVPAKEWLFSRETFLGFVGDIPVPPPATLPPSPPVATERLRVQQDGLRVRERPGTQYGILRTLQVGEEIEVTTDKFKLTDHTWRQLASGPGFVAQSNDARGEVYLAPPLPPMDTASIRGVNLDPRNPTAKPTPEALRGHFQYARFVLDLSLERGNTDWSLIEPIYAPYIESLKQAGIQTILVLNHELFGEGRKNWPTMQDSDWLDFADEWALYAGEAARRFPGCVYQIWNEQDQMSNTSVGMSPRAYAGLLGAALKRIEPSKTVIAGGLASGRYDYWQTVEALLDPATLRQLDGVALHPYGRGEGKYGREGRLEPFLDAYQRVTAKPLWITEFGAQNPVETPAVVEEYMNRFFATCANRSVRAAVWFAWGKQDRNFALGNPVTGRIRVQFA